ncbi:MAG: HPr kinase/phosphatase C-terminal domain-containing protein [Alphaproteobacteria bacterium]|nr:HPr kinase/phosphatase C-terminal domain-containing protein [Alphaproteobacteria bacterium]
MERIHATCVVVEGRGVLLRGGSGSGKSDLALRLMSAGAALVADDYADLDARDGGLRATAPPATAGLLEVRGLGVVDVGCVKEAEVVLVVDLVPPDEVERMPEESACVFLGCPVRRVSLAPFEASAVAKVTLAVRLAAGGLALAP